MEPTERDELLVRIDERLKYTCELTEKQEKHLSTLNDRTRKSELNIDRNHYRLTNLEDDIKTLVNCGLPLRLTKGQAIGGGSGVLGMVAVLIVSVGKILGWW